MGTISYLAKMAADREKRAALWDKLFRMGMLTPKSMRRLYRGANVKQLKVPDSADYTHSHWARGSGWARPLTGKPLSRVKNKDLVESIRNHRMENQYGDYFTSAHQTTEGKSGHWLWDVIRKGLQPSSTASNPMQAGRFLKLQQGKTQAAQAASRAAEAAKNKAAKAMRKTPWQSSRKSAFKQKVKQELPSHPYFND